MLGSKKRLIAAVAGTAFVISGCGASGDDGEGTPVSVKIRERLVAAPLACLWSGA